MKYTLYFIRSISLLMAMLLLPLLCIAQSIQNQQVYTRYGKLQISANAQVWYNNLSSGSNAVVWMQAVFHLSHIPDSKEKNDLKNAGIILGDYVGRASYTGIIQILPQGNNVMLPGILIGISSINNEWKLDEFTSKYINATNGKGKIDLFVSFFDINESDIKTYLFSIGAEIDNSSIQGIGYYKITLPATAVEKLKKYYAVKSISRNIVPQALNSDSRNASKSNIGSLNSNFGGYGLSGNGVTVGIGDNVSAIGHIDLKDRVINFNPQPYTNHGLHINGIAGGAGIADIKGTGVATGARFINHLFNQIWEQTPDFHQQYNMTITNNSYAAVIRDCNYAGTYNTYSEAVDKLSLQYRDVLHVFAAGNDGLMTCNPYPEGYGTVVGAYQASKNALVVTSADKRYVNAKDGGRGPIKDGRLKPEITAVGVDVYSATRVDSYFVSGGTSMASPGVAGALALLTEKYKQLYGNANPRADILKAIIVNGATDIGNPGPDYRFGFGFMNLSRSLKMLDSNSFFTGIANNGGQQVHNINVPVNTSKLKVMLYWHDAPSGVLSAKQLINDLDITVTSPNASVSRPLVLDSSPSNVLKNATEGIDRLNNIEQVIIDKPVSGDYIVSVSGFNIPSVTQDYVVAYDIIPDAVFVTYPTTGAQVANADTLRVYWDASDDNNTQSLEYTIDGGSNWLLIDKSIPASQRYYSWYVPSNISSGKCMMRVLRNNTAMQHTTGLFAINTIPVVSLGAIQCPGYININWQSINNASGYEVMRKIGASMQVVDTITGTEYVFSGLTVDSIYYVAVRPIIDGLSGYRSLALKYMPIGGDCTGSISDGDLVTYKTITPVNGRKFTNTELKNTEIVKLLVRNLDDAGCDSFKVSYRINGGIWKSRDYLINLPALSITEVIVDTVDLSAIGTYNFELAVQNLSITDPVIVNDTIRYAIKHVNNFPVSLASTVITDFEDWQALETNKDIFGISPDERWDYDNANDTCRLRSFVKNDITISGTRSISLDAIIHSNNNHLNELMGTYNLASYKASEDEVRFEFDYLLHGYISEEDSNAIYVRGNDTQPWQRLYSYNNKNASTGKISKSGSLSVTDRLLASSQDFSSSFQLKFMQNDVSLISMRGFGRGVTIDNMKLYTVQNDIQLLSVVSPMLSECGLKGEQLVTIKIRNGVNQQLYNIQVYMKYDNSPVISEVINTIKGKETINYTFKEKINLDENGKHVLNIWLVANGDTYLLNDSILNYEFYNQPLIINYPYFENFEKTNGSWYTTGLNNSWQYGQLLSPSINKAASGTNAWKTNLSGIYNASELSYLLSPCFDMSGLKKPAFRFKSAIDIENCGQIFCDGAYMEYSSDGIEWIRLGKSGEGNQWYNDSLYNIWTIENAVSWQSRSIALPKGSANLRLRFVFTSDLGAEREGLAIDDVEVFDDIPIPVENNLLNVVPNPTKDGRITIDWTAHGGTILEMSMYNIAGKQVYKSSATAHEGRNSTIIQTPNFQPGVYIIHIVIGDKKYSRKIVYL